MSRTLYHKKYYRINALKKLREKVKQLELSLQTFKDSPEGKMYYKRKASEYGKKWREENKYL